MVETLSEKVELSPKGLSDALNKAWDNFVDHPELSRQYTYKIIAAYATIERTGNQTLINNFYMYYWEAILIRSELNNLVRVKLTPVRYNNQAHFKRKTKKINYKSCSRTVVR